MRSAIVYLTLAALLARLGERRREQAFPIAAALVVIGIVGGSRV